MSTDDPAPPIHVGAHSAWYHGSPLRLEQLAAGSTVTPVVELAEAFSHKPTSLGIEIREKDGERSVRIAHDGTQHGYLFRVLVTDPAIDLRPHPTSTCAPGEEVLTTKDLELEFLRELPVE